MRYGALGADAMRSGESLQSNFNLSCCSCGTRVSCSHRSHSIGHVLCGCYEAQEESKLCYKG